MGIRLTCLGLLVTLAGCAAPPTYRVRINMPWPDEWVAGAERSDRIDLPIAEDAIRWHRTEDLAAVGRRITRLASRFPGVAVMIRGGFADRLGKSGKPKHALSLLEVRVTSWPLPTGRDLGPSDWSITDESLEEVVELCAARIGAVIRLDRGVDPLTPVDFQVESMGASEALACILLGEDLYLGPICLGTSVLRSYEFRSRQAFERAVEVRMREASRARPQGPYVVMRMERWVEAHAAQLRHLGLWELSSGDLSSREDGISRTERAGRYLRRLVELRLQDRRERAEGVSRAAHVVSSSAARASDESAIPSAR